MKKKRKTKKAIKDLHLDKPTSHGGWPHGHPGSYTDPNTPVNKQISNYLEAMGLIDDGNPRAKLSENKIKALIREVIKENQERDSLKELTLSIQRALLVAERDVPAQYGFDKMQVYHTALGELERFRQRIEFAQRKKDK